MTLIYDYYFYVAAGVAAVAVAIALFFGMPRWFSPRD
jgi:hypothetical protein